MTGHSLTGDPVTYAVVPAAVKLVWSVRTQDAADVVEAIEEARLALDGARVADCSELVALRTLVVVLAAMVPEDRSPSDLLMWLQNPDEYMQLRHDGYAAGTAASIAAARVRHAA